MSNLFDEEFLSLQEFLSKLIPETVLITPHTILPSDSNSLIHLLYKQTKVYASKILDLYETLDQNYQEEAPAERTVFESADFQSNLSPIKVSHAHYERTIEALTKERESLLLCLEKYRDKPFEINETLEEYDLDNKETLMKNLEGCFIRKDGFLNGCRILQNMDYEIIKEIEINRYVNWLTIANRLKDQSIERIFDGFLEKLERENMEEVFEQKDFFHLAKQIEDFLKKYEVGKGFIPQIEEHMNGKIEYLNAEIVRLNEALEEKNKENELFMKERDPKEKIKELEHLLTNEKINKQDLEGDLTELLDEFKLMKEKFEELAKENEKLKDQNEFSEKMEDIEKANEQLREKDQELLLKTEEFTSKLSQKEDLLQKLTYEKEILLKRTSPFDFTRLFSIIIELETRILPLLTPILEDQNLSEAVTFRIKSLEQELLTLFSFFKDLQNNPLTDKNKDNRRLSNENTKESPLKDSSRIDAYWKSVVMALTFEKEHLLKRFENPNTESLYNRIKELEESLQEKNNQTQDQNSNENYWKSLISSLSDEKEQLLKKLETLGNKNSQYVLESLKIQVRELEDVLHEKNSQIMSFNELIQEWQLKYSQIEEEIHENGLEALTKEDTLEREIVSLKEQLFLNEKLLGSREAEILDYCQTLSQRTEKQKALETENRKLIIELNEAKLKLSRIDKDYEETQNLVKSLKEELALIQKNKDLSSIHEQQLLELSSKFEDFRTKSFEKIEALSQELEHTESMRNDLLKGYEEKSQENNELMEMLKELELLTESQGKTLSLKETQINNIENKMKLLENEKNICEKKMNELQELKMRNKRCLETITGSSNEINGLKKEMEALMNSQKVLQEKLFEKESLIIELNHLIKGSKAQTEKNIKALDEKEHLINELRRSKGQNEGNSKGLFEKEGIILEQSQQIKLLKGLLDKNHEELEGVKRERDNVSIEYQKLIERNEKMMMDSDKFLTIEMLNKEKNVEDIEERTAFLDVTNMQMMKSMKDQVEKKEKMIASFRPPKKIIEERDLEIKRLSKIVKTLSTKCLSDGIFQNSNNKGFKR